jgi:hypothetical protein
MRRKEWTELQSGVMWHGHIADLARLVYCLAAHCTCGGPLQVGDSRRQCSAHRMLADQVTLDHLAFARGMRDQFLKAEWVVDATPDSQPELDWRVPRESVGSSQVHQTPIRPRRPRTLAYTLAGLLVVFSVIGTTLSPSTNLSPIGAWQTR